MISIGVCLIEIKNIFHSCFAFNSKHSVMIKLRLTVWLLLFCMAPSVQADQTRVSIEHDGYLRTYLLYIPSRQIEGLQSPLVIALHGRTSNGERMAQLTELNRLADQKNFIVAYPDGIDNQWNYLHGMDKSCLLFLLSPMPVVCPKPA